MKTKSWKKNPAASLLMALLLGLTFAPASLAAATTPAGPDTGTDKAQPDLVVQVVKTEQLPPVTGKGPVLPPKPADRPPLHDKVWNVEPPPDVVANQKTPAAEETAPLGLPRLKSAGGVAKIPRAKYDVDELAASQDGRFSRREEEGIAWLEISSPHTWSRPLRGAKTDIVFVSFVLNAGVGTIINAGGAALRVDEGASPGRATVSIGRSGETGIIWTPTKYGVGVGQFGPLKLALLPVFTVRLDPEVGVWDLYAGPILLEADCPLIEAEKGPRKLAIQPGPAGAWICGIVVGQENPLFQDDNKNGLPDEREREQLGTLLTRENKPETRGAVVKKTKLFDPYATNPAFRFPRPMPDRPPTRPVLPN